jgi:hypothetical protein
VDVLFSEPLGILATAVGGVLVLIGLFANRRIATLDF